LRAYWSRARVDKDNLEMIYNQISNVVDLPDIEIVNALAVTNIEKQMIQDMSNTEPELASLNDNQKRMFSDGMSFMVHYKKISQ
jgi:hypothetical protein